MRNDVFSRSPFGRKAYAHGLHFDPALDRSPLEPPLPPDSPILARWSAVRNCLPPLAELLEVGYLVKEQAHDEAGKFASNIFVLQEEAPLSGNPIPGKPSTENPTLRKEEYKKKVKNYCINI